MSSSEARTHTNLGWASCGKCSKPGCFGIPADFLRGLIVANSLLGTSGLVGTSGREQASGYVQPSSVLLISCSVLVWFGSLVARIFFKLFEGEYWQYGRRILNILFVQTPAVFRNGWPTQSIRYVKAFEDGTIPDTETLSLTHLLDRVRWPTVTVDPAKLNHCPLPDQQIQDSTIAH